MARVAIGCDPNAVGLKDILKAHLAELGHEVEDFGGDDPIYANTAIRVAESVAAGNHERGVLLCGTGIGVSISANKVPGAYAALVTDPYSAERAQKSNNANIICMGAQTSGSEVAKYLISVYMGSAYVPGGRSEPKIQRIYEYEKQRRTE